jgi:hypothetical protein
MSSRTKILGEDDHEASGNYTDRLILLSKHAVVFFGFIAAVHIAGLAVKDE